MKTQTSLERPVPGECDDYYFLYIKQVPDGDVMEMLAEQLVSTPKFLSSLDPAALDYRYAPGKWSVKEIVGHLIDVERAFTHRAFCAARNEPAELPSLEQDPYVENSRYSVRPLSAIMREYTTTRSASLALFDSFDQDEWMRRIRASGMDFTARVFPFTIVGHEIHHLAVIREKYTI